MCISAHMSLKMLFTGYTWDSVFFSIGNVVRERLVMLYNLYAEGVNETHQGKWLQSPWLHAYRTQSAQCRTKVQK